MKESLVIVSLVISLLWPVQAHADCQVELGLCHQALIELLEVRDAQNNLIVEQERQIKDMESERAGGGFQWEWLALGLAAGLAGGLVLK